MDYVEYKELLGRPLDDGYIESIFDSVSPIRSTRIKPLDHKISIVRAPVKARVFVVVCNACEKILGEDIIEFGMASKSFLHAIYDQHCDWHGVDDEGVVE
jgi:hypothetical protein